MPPHDPSSHDSGEDGGDEDDDTELLPPPDDRYPALWEHAPLGDDVNFEYDDVYDGVSYGVPGYNDDDAIDYWDDVLNVMPTGEHALLYDASRSAKRQRVGRPAKAEVAAVDHFAFAQCCHASLSNDELAIEFQLSIGDVKNLKRKLELTWLRRQALPSLEELREVWTQAPLFMSQDGVPLPQRPKSVACIANELGLSTSSLRRHIKNIGFDPKCAYSLDDVKAAVRPSRQPMLQQLGCDLRSIKPLLRKEHRRSSLAN